MKKILFRTVVVLCSLVLTTAVASENRDIDLNKALFSVLLDKENPENKREEVETLIQQGADVNAQIKHNSLTYTPLYAAVLTGDAKLVQLLLDAGAQESINATVMGTDSPTALHTAIRRNMPVMVELLLSKGANPDLTVFSNISNKQVTALELAQELGFSDSARLLQR